MKIAGAEIFAVELPFRRRFRHGAHERRTSASVFLKLTTVGGTVGYGETLPREYVTGESVDSVCSALRRWMPRLSNLEFSGLDDTIDFLTSCDGAPPPDWGLVEEPQTSAWCALDLALLDAASKDFQTPLSLGRSSAEAAFCYAAVLSAERLPRSLLGLLKMRLYGMRDVKLKLDAAADLRPLAAARLLLRQRASLRVDCNMAWTLEQSFAALPLLERYQICALEQPLAAADLDGASAIVSKTAIPVIADESFSTAESLRLLVRRKACSGVNVRLAKCGGLVASLRRLKEAQAAGLTVIVGCQVGESSLLSAAQLRLLGASQGVSFAEGCFGTRLLSADPAYPQLQFSYAGAPPPLPKGLGHGVLIDESVLRKHTNASVDTATDNLG